MKRPLSLVGVLAALGPLALTGCGSSGTTVTIPNSNNAQVSTPLSTQTTAPASESAAASRAAAPNASSPPAFVIDETGSGGDHVRLEGRFGPLVPASRSSANPTLLGECQGSPERDMSVELGLTVTVLSNLAAEVSVEIDRDTWAGQAPWFILNDTEDGLHCLIPGQYTVSFGSLAPHQPGHLTIWLILPETISPNDPHPSPKRLTGQYRLAVPQLRFTGGGSEQSTVTGPQVASCENGQDGADQFIAITTELPRAIKNTMGEPETECKAQG